MSEESWRETEEKENERGGKEERKKEQLRSVAEVRRKKKKERREESGKKKVPSSSPAQSGTDARPIKGARPVRAQPATAGLVRSYWAELSSNNYPF